MDLLRYLCCFAALWLVACAGIPHDTKKDFSCRWKTERYTVDFTAGPRSGNGSSRAFSYYVVSRIATDKDTRRIIESAQSSDSFRADKHWNPRIYTRIVEDATANQILIEENIPNDCAPCKNFALVTEEDDGFLTCRYLLLPEASNIKGDVDSEFPTVTKLRGDSITYRYSRGQDITRKIDEFETTTEPMPPG